MQWEPDSPTATERAWETRQPGREVAGVRQVVEEVEQQDVSRPSTPVGKRMPLMKQPVCRWWPGARFSSGRKESGLFRCPEVSVGGKWEKERGGHPMEEYLSSEGVLEQGGFSMTGAVELFSTVQESESSVRRLVNRVAPVRLCPEMPVLLNKRNGESAGRMKQTVNRFSMGLLSGGKRTEQQEEETGRETNVAEPEVKREPEDIRRGIRREKEGRLSFPLPESAPRERIRPVAGERVRNVNTHIDRLIDHFEIYTTAPEMDLNRVKEMVVDVLTGAVNDFSRTGGRDE